MNKILLIALTLFILGCGQPLNQLPSLPTKTEYLRIGFSNGKEIYLQVNGTSRYTILYDDLYLQLSEKNSCGECRKDKIATDVTYFTIVSEQEYNIKHLGINAPITTTPEPQSTEITY